MKVSMDHEELKEREEFAEMLRTREDVPALDFDHGSDGVFRVVVPREVRIGLGKERRKAGAKDGWSEATANAMF